MNKEKIEEILLHLDSYFEQAMGTEVTREDWVNLRKELSDLISTLIQEERKDAVEGFRELRKKMSYSYYEMSDDKNTGDWIEELDKYLESEGKE